MNYLLLTRAALALQTKLLIVCSLQSAMGKIISYHFIIQETLKYLNTFLLLFCNVTLVHN